jgi:plasmid stability protein
MGAVKTTVELPDELMRAVKIRAVNDGRKLKDVMADLIRRGLADNPEPAGGTPRRVRLPLVQCAHSARPDKEMTPDRVAEILRQEDARDVR